METSIDKVITVHDYYDGILMGVATFDKAPCIYESLRYGAGQLSSDLFYLTPIDGDALQIIMEEWEFLIQWGKNHESFDSWTEETDIDLVENLTKISKESKKYRQHIRHGKFNGKFKLDSHIDSLTVVWSECTTQQE